NVNVDPAPANFTVLPEVRIFQLPAVGGNAPPLLPVIVLPTVVPPATCNDNEFAPVVNDIELSDDVSVANAGSAATAPMRTCPLLPTESWVTADVPAPTKTP